MSALMERKVEERRDNCELKNGKLKPEYSTNFVDE
jgi:hypothetical protein